MPVWLWMMMGALFVVPPVIGLAVVIMGITRFGGQAGPAIAFAKGIVYGAAGGLAVAGVTLALVFGLKAALGR